MLNNWRRGRERADVWLARFSEDAVKGKGRKYWGFTYMAIDEVEELLDKLKASHSPKNAQPF